MEEVLLQEVETYFSCHQNTVAHFIATGPIMDLCLEADRCPGSWVEKHWWEQEGLDLEGMWTADQEEEEEEWEAETDGMATGTVE